MSMLRAYAPRIGQAYARYGRTYLRRMYSPSDEASPKSTRATGEAR